MAQLPNIKMVDFPADEYIAKETTKTQIYLHHTAGNGNGVSTFKYWDKAEDGRIATCICISNGNNGGVDGEIVQGFSSKYWAYHLGVREGVFKKRNLPYKNLNEISIGIEICAWGSLSYRDGKYFSWSNVVVPENEVEHLDKPFRGVMHFHRYTTKQIESVCNLLLYWKERYGIDITYKPENFWDISENALKGNNGLYGHAAVRVDKTDVYPCKELIEALKGLK
jgi:N-acetyl-anhydromuramyl-L-alanine amidase AmpD